MKLHRSGAELFVPDGLPPAGALERTTHLGVSAHQDDLEIMAYHGILEGFSREDRWFTGVVVTDGAGRYLHTVYNVKMGTGDTPLHAALDGYRQVAPEHSSYWAVVGLELEAEMLRRAVVRARAWESRLDAAVDALVAAIGLFR